MKKRLLVIDDNEDVRKSFILALENAPYEVNSAKSGEEGLASIAEKSYDLIFLDLKMPGLNGVETLRRIRNMDPGVPVYIITAFHEMYMVQLKELQKDKIDFELLKKPVLSSQINKISQAILEKQFICE